MATNSEPFRSRKRITGEHPPMAPPLPPNGKQEIPSVKVRKRRFIAAMREHMAIVAYAAEATHIPSSTHYRWMSEDPEYKEAILDTEARMVGFTERKLLNLVDQGDREACKFVLDRRGARQGWSNRMTVTHEGNPDSPMLMAHHHTIDVKFLEQEAPLEGLVKLIELLRQHGANIPALQGKQE